MNIPKIKSRHLISISDLSANEIIDIFNFAAKLKKDLGKGKIHNYLARKTLGMIFEKSSTRTRVSFETGIFQLGGQALFLGTNDLQLGRGETIADTARVLSRYIDAIMIRTYAQTKIEELAANSDIPVINGLSDTSHPCQALADFFSIYERKGRFNNLKLLYVGDGNNVANSLLLGGSILGMNVTVACPKSYQPDTDIVNKAKDFSSVTGAVIEVTSDIDKAARGANFIYTDVWISMGQEKEAKQKKQKFKKFKISKEILDKCAEDCLVMHCLPAHRGEEIDGEVMDSGKSIIFDQAENRLHVQKAILCALIK